MDSTKTVTELLNDPTTYQKIGEALEPIGQGIAIGLIGVCALVVASGIDAAIRFARKWRSMR